MLFTIEHEGTIASVAQRIVQRLRSLQHSFDYFVSTARAAFRVQALTFDVLAGTESINRIACVTEV
jgi:hypothetical protein